MATVEQRTHSDHAKMWSTIDDIVLSLDRFNEKLSDDRKIRLFTMSREDLTKLARDVDDAPARMKAISLIVAAITATEQKREEEKELALGKAEPDTSTPLPSGNVKTKAKPASKKRSSSR